MKTSLFKRLAMLGCIVYACAMNAQTTGNDATIVYIDGVYYRLMDKEATTISRGDAGKGRRCGWEKLLEPDYPLHIVIPSEIAYEGKTYKVTRIGNSTFNLCFELLSITLPNTITAIGETAFGYCEKLQTVRIPQSVTSLGYYAFDKCSGLSSIVIPEGVETIKAFTFARCENLSSVTLPSSLKVIEFYTFVMCTSLPYLEIPESVKTIEEGAFCNCQSLMSISLPRGIKRIENRTFYNCQALSLITIPDDVTFIASEAFAGCTGLASVTLPENLTQIGDNAFAQVPDTANIYCNAREPFTISENTFNFNCTLHVPYGCKEKYEKADYWKNFTNIEEMERSDEPVRYSDETGVAPAVSDAAVSDGHFYDLQGRPTDGTKKGLYIRNGKKVLVK